MHIGILTCSAVTQDLACSSFNCLKQLRGGKDKFSPYHGNATLAGIINCAGCMAHNAPDKLLKRVRSLTELKPDAIHLSTCMINLCPFKEQYFKLLSETFPHIHFVKGTHDAPVEMSDAEHAKAHRTMVNDLLKRGGTMGDVMSVLYVPS